MIRAFLRSLARPAAPAITFLRPWKPHPEQWATIFRNWPEDDERWRAVWDIITAHLEAELNDAMKPGDPHEIAQRNGRIQALLFLRTQFLNLRQKS